MANTNQAYVEIFHCENSNTYPNIYLTTLKISMSHWTITLDGHCHYYLIPSSHHYHHLRDHLYKYHRHLFHICYCHRHVLWCYDWRRAEGGLKRAIRGHLFIKIQKRTSVLVPPPTTTATLPTSLPLLSSNIFTILSMTYHILLLPSSSLL